MPQPSSLNTASQPTRLSAIKRVTIAALAAVILFMGSAPSSSVAGYTGSPRFAKGAVLTYCIDPYFTELGDGVFKTYIISGVESWDNQASALTLNYSTATSGSGFNDCDLRIKRGSSNVFNNLTNDITLVHPGMSWVQLYNTCQHALNDQCPPYATTVIKHEVGHFLGFGHYYGQCYAGYYGSGGSYTYYYSNQTAAACNADGEKLMHNNAGDGFFRTHTTDEINGVNAWYDW